MDDECHAALAAHSWHRSKNGYAVRHEVRDGKRVLVLMHREILAVEGGQQVDHRNRDRLDNRRENLRAATHAQNQANQVGHRKRRSQYKGVYLMTGKPRTVPYRAKITVGGRMRHLGVFASEEEAARAYDRAAREHFGEFACLNFPAEAAA